jgi:ribosomal protein S18 acetylase RimI-like enzyme
MRTVALALLLCQNGEAFVSKSVANRNLDIRSPVTRVEMFFAQESSPQKPPVTDSKTFEKSPVAVDLVSSEDERFINMVGSFLVDNFWLNSQHHKTEGDISDEARMNLVVEQCSDLQEKYGERMGKRLTNSCIIGALSPDSKEMVGVATIKTTLLINGDVLEAEKAEAIAKNAVASLGPKQRREYKDSSINTIAAELLSPDSKAIVVLSNLAISGKARKQGIAQKICEEAETLAQSWGYSDMWLLVESENIAARKLYEDKLGYKVAFRKDGEIALRADIDMGSFYEVQADTLMMVKNL